MDQMSNSAYVGLALTAHRNGATDTTQSAEFTNVQITDTGGMTTQFREVTAPLAHVLNMLFRCDAAHQFLGVVRPQTGSFHAVENAGSTDRIHLIFEYFDSVFLANSSSSIARLSPSR